MPYIRLGRFSKVSCDNSQLSLNAKSWFNNFPDYDVALKRECSSEDPVFIINTDTTTIGSGANYCVYYQRTYDNPLNLRFYFVTDVVQITKDICEVHCSMDYLTTMAISSDFSSMIHGTLDICSIGNFWDSTIQDNRWAPDKVMITGQTLLHSNVGAAGVGVDGTYFLKWWNSASVRNSVVCLLCDKANFNNFLAQLVFYIKNHPEDMISGISDFTQFIQSAKFFPGVDLADMATAAGYTQLTATNELLVGGFAVIEDIQGYVYVDSNGYAMPYAGHVELFDEDFVFQPFGHAYSDGDMNFLVSNRWMDVQMITASGYMSIPADELYNGITLNLKSYIDLETGTVSSWVRKKIPFTSGTPPVSTDNYEVIAHTESTCFIDCMNMVGKIQSIGERFNLSVPDMLSAGIQSVTNPVGGASSFLGAGANAFLGSAQVSMHSSGGYASTSWLQYVCGLTYWQICWYIYGNSRSPIKSTDGTYTDMLYNYTTNYANIDGYIAVKRPTYFHTLLEYFNNESTNHFKCRFSDIDTIQCSFGPKGTAALKNALLNGLEVYKVH